MPRRFNLTKAIKFTDLKISNDNSLILARNESRLRDHNRVLELSRSMGNQKRSEFLSIVATKRARNGYIKTGKIIALRIENVFLKIKTLVALSVIEATITSIPRAQKTIKQCKKMVELLRGKQRSASLIFIANAEIIIGDLESAQETAELLRDEDLEYSIRLGIAQSGAGKLRLVEKT